MIPKGVLKMMLPIACSWAEKQEGLILREGVALGAALFSDAQRIGIVHPERVRLRVVDEIPWPLHPLLRQAAETTGLLSADTTGLALRYGIYIRADRWGERRLVVHELAHTAQYERLGGFRPFLDAYLAECIDPGYPLGALEQEAKRIEQEICG
jgi:hypothetical protein